MTLYLFYPLRISWKTSIQSIQQSNMNKLLLFIFMYTFYLQYQTLCSDTGTAIRQKRGVLDLVVTLWCYRNRLKVPLLGINLYGCYCGTGGTGGAVDNVDRCCLLHDCCYRYSRIDLQCHSKIKWQFYQFSCGPAQTQCHSSTLCGRMACECDKLFAECLTKAKPKKKHFFYNRKDMCVGPHDACPQLHPNITSVLQWTQNQTTSELGNGNWLDKPKSRKKRWRRRNMVAMDKKRKTIQKSPLWI
ncbi:otoconin-90-like isoform X2 [Hyla sarda]|uniref:otoconin-90-like isoform X2 n=1 Tax=Hyla sarda TaxID=327740 RepID=UPI0024C20F82|nr:otoconin-90-like isoform X2 [Hyla sarda]